MREYKEFSDEETDDEGLRDQMSAPLIEFSDEESDDDRLPIQMSTPLIEEIFSSESSLDSDSSLSSDDSDYKPSDEEDEPLALTAAGEQSTDEDDAVVRAISAAKKEESNHPPTIEFQNYVMDLSFHPSQHMLAVSSITGDVFIYSYTSSNCDLVGTLELHSKSCRNVEYSPDGLKLVSCGKEKSIMVTDTNTNKLVQFYDDAHDSPPYSLYVLNDTTFCTGDEGGVLKVWDLRQKNPICSYKTGEEQITSIISNDDGRYIVCSVSDSLSTYDFNSRKLFVQSEAYETELTSLNLVKRGTKLVVGTYSGALYIFNWGQFGYHSDVYPGPKHTISAGLSITENILITGRDDGQIMATNLFPHKQLGVLGQHRMSVEAMDIDFLGTYVASIGLDETVKFWNIRYLEDLHVKTEKAKKTDARNNLPSSEISNPGAFFSGLN